MLEATLCLLLRENPLPDVLMGEGKYVTAKFVYDSNGNLAMREVKTRPI